MIPWQAGTAASQYSHDKYFPYQEAYNEYYNYVVDTCDIGVESFATRAQTMLVDHLHEHFGDGIPNWCRTFLPEARGRICLAYSQYAGCNNMGIEVSWHDIKNLSSYPKTLSCNLLVVTASKREHTYHLPGHGGGCFGMLATHTRSLCGTTTKGGWALDLCELKTILVPRQALLKTLDPTGELLVPTVHAQLEPLVGQYERSVIQDQVDDGTQLNDENPRP
jgi:hypothetical protein